MTFDNTYLPSMLRARWRLHGFQTAIGVLFYPPMSSRSETLRKEKGRYVCLQGVFDRLGPKINRCERLVRDK